MASEEQITKMTTAIKQAIKVMGDRFGSTELDVAKAVEALKASMQIEDGKTVPLRSLGGRSMDAGKAVLVLSEGIAM